MRKRFGLQEFPTAAVDPVACRVQDDMGGEGMWTGEIEAE
jgi:hypothetical protein